MTAPLVLCGRKIQLGSRLLSADEARSYALSILMAVDALESNTDLLQFASSQFPPQGATKTRVAVREKTLIGLLGRESWQPLMALSQGMSGQMTQYAESLARQMSQSVILHNESVLTTETLFNPL